MQIENYKKLYIADDDELVTEYIKDTGLVWCSRSWEWIYSKKPRTCNSETLRDYSIVWCESNEEFEYLKEKIKDFKHPDIFNYSFEFDFPSIMIKTEYLYKCLE